MLLQKIYLFIYLFIFFLFFFIFFAWVFFFNLHDLNI
jgi:hypothetical protein